MKRTAKRTTTIIVGVVIILVGAGAAFAYWTNSGSGTGSGGTGTNVAVVVNQTSTVSGMAPGVAAQALSGNFDNPNAGPVYVASVTAAVTATDKVGCSPADYTIAGTATVGTEVAPGNGKGSWSGLTIQFNNKPGVNQDACKTAAVTITYASS